MATPRRSRSAGALALLATLLGGCATALAPLTPEQETGLREVQRIADQVTKAYGVPGVRVYPASLGPAAGGTYAYQYDWIFIRPEVLGNKRRLVLISHELGHATLGHRPIDDARRATEGVERERDANRRGVEIMVKFLGLTEREALDSYAAYLMEANRYRHGRDVLLPLGHLLPCEELRELWTHYGQTAPACESFIGTATSK
jgi:IrrE N-terminal-like domain